MKDKGIVLSKDDPHIQAKAKNLGLGVIIDSEMPLSFNKTLFVDPGTKIPWDLLGAAWHFLDRWDAAIPLWRYGVTADDVGTSDERKRTKAIVRDLRVLLHSVELLFVRNNSDGQSLIQAYREECENSCEKRLAFLRAFYRTKPRVCVLPTSWLHETRQREKQDWRRGKRNLGQRLVTVEISPGRFVKCNPGDEKKVLESIPRGRNRDGKK